MNKTSYKNIVCTFLFFALCTSVRAQQTVTETFNNTPLAEVFQVFADKYNLLLAYDEQIVTKRSIQLNFQGEHITTALYQVLDQAQLDYFTLDERQILIRAKANQEAPRTIPLRHLSGRISDHEDGEGLAFATILIAGTTIGTAADADGHYHLSWPDTLGTQLMIEARYLGYINQRKAYQQQERADFKMKAAAQSLGIIIVTDKLPSLSLSVKDQAMNLFSSSSIPGLGGQTDLLRTVQLLPGVAAYNDRSAALNVRGSQADENMLNWDGMLLYQIDHFFGAFGAVNTAMVESSKLYKNNFPVNYGGRTGAILALESPQTVDELNGSLQLGSLLLEGHVQLPLAKGMSLQVGSRTTFNNIATTDLFGVLQQEVNRPSRMSDITSGVQTVSIQPNFSFYDFNAKWSWQINEQTNIDVNYFRSADDYNYDYSQTAISERFNRIFTNNASFGEQAQWENEASSIRWQQEWSEQFQQEWTLGQSTYSIAEETTGSLEVETPNNSFNVIDSRITRNNEIEALHADLNNKLLLNAENELHFGTRFIQESAAVKLNNDSLKVLQNNSEATQLGIYASWQAEQKQWDWATDLHATYYSATRNWYWSPRLRASVQLNEQWRLKAAANKYFQFLRAFYHENRFGRTVTIWSMADDFRFPVAESNQLMLGFTYTKDNFSIDGEFFVKQTQGVLEHTSIFNGFQRDSLVNLPIGSNSFQILEGENQVIGLDLLLRQRWGSYDTWLSYTLSKSTRQFEQIFQGRSYASQDDRPHQMNWVNTYHKEDWSFSAIYVFASGRPYFDLSTPALEPDRRLRDPDSWERIQNYHRLDLSLQRKWTFDSDTQLSLSAAIYNVFNRQNSLYNQQVYKIPQEGRPDLLLGNELELMNRSLGLSLGLAF